MYEILKVSVCEIVKGCKCVRLCRICGTVKGCESEELCVRVHLYVIVCET